ncbi:glycosyltransferase family 4 protein [Desertimonas flava]|uniref:glycosyltransferase family 4 protein n=1 Tax=Desertimonas flava TaxID=2064846 RepID=UPI001D0CD91E|nr:glycosyltransferase family 4 protein [Desertimonas flava]
MPRNPSVLRIGLVSPYSLTVPGGVQAQVIGLARELRRRGHEARVLGPCDGPPPESFVTPLGNSLPTAANGSIAPLAPDAPAALRTIRALRDEEFDVVHVHEPLAPGPSMTSVVLRSAPLVGTFHAAGTSASYRVFTPFLRRLLRNLDCKVVVSKDALDLVESHLGGNGYRVLFNGVDIASIESATPMPAVAPTIFFCGRHEERKGLAVLLDAFAELPPEARLWIASDGPDTPMLRARTTGDERISWLGRIDDTEKFARLRGATVFCAPSLHGESFGVVLIEAMAAGTPVVASSLDGYRNVATDGVDSILVPPGDVHALADALQRTLSDAALRERLRIAGSSRAHDFSMRHLADEYVAIYRELIDRPPRL